MVSAQLWWLGFFHRPLLSAMGGACTLAPSLLFPTHSGIPRWQEARGRMTSGDMVIRGRKAELPCTSTPFHLRSHTVAMKTTGPTMKPVPSGHRADPRNLLCWSRSVSKDVSSLYNEGCQNLVTKGLVLFHVIHF